MNDKTLKFTSKREARGFKAAMNAAEFVTHSRYKMGAALFIRNRLISIGWNNQKTHPKSWSSPFKWQHAEINCLIGVNKIDLSKATLYVARLTKSGFPRISKPCQACMEYMKIAGVKEVCYITRDLKVQKFKF